MKKIFLAFLVHFTVFTANTQSSFIVNTTGTSAEMDEAIEYVTDLWSQYLNSTVPITINLSYGNLGSTGTLGSTVPNPVKNFDGAPMIDVWFPMSLANSIAGVDLNEDEADMDIFINSMADLYLGTDGNAGDQHDFVSLLMHEIVHGLGGVSLSLYEGGSGSIGMFSDSDVFLPLSFEIPDLEGLSSIWDQFIINGDGEFIIDTSLFPNPSSALGSELVSNNLFFFGSYATLVNEGTYPRIYAPGVFNIGSSIHHFNESTFPLASGNSMFTPFLASGEVEHSPGPVLLGALTDIGWSVNESVGVEELAEESPHFYPNPASSTVHFEMNGNSNQLKIIDLMGNVVVDHINTSSIDLTLLCNGTYVIAGLVDGEYISERLVVVD